MQYKARYAMTPKGKVGISLQKQICAGIVGPQHLIKTLVSIFGAEHLARLARIYEQQFIRAKEDRPRVRVKAATE